MSRDSLAFLVVFLGVCFSLVSLGFPGVIGREPLCPPLGFALEYLGVGSPTSPRRPLYPGTWRRSIVAAACSSGQRCLAHCPPDPGAGTLAYTRTTRAPRLGQSDLSLSLSRVPKALGGLCRSGSPTGSGAPSSAPSRLQTPSSDLLEYIFLISVACCFTP